MSLNYLKNAVNSQICIKKPIISGHTAQHYLLVYLKEGKRSVPKYPCVCCLQDTSSRAPTGSPRTSNRSAAANVANAMPQSGKPSPPFLPYSQPLTSVPRFAASVSLCSAGQTSEGVLANFFNSLLTKKSGTGATGTPGGGNNTPGTVRKSGEKLSN